MQIKKNMALAAFISAVVGASAQDAVATAPDIASRDISDPTLNEWVFADWSNAPGSVLTLDDHPDGQSAATKTLRLEARYAARTFGGVTAIMKPGELPGVPVRMEGWVRTNGGLWFTFKDANTNDIPAKIQMVDDPKAKVVEDGQTWNKVIITFPESIKKNNQQVPVRYPIRLDNLGGHNWGSRNSPEPKTQFYDMYDMRLYTDMATVAVEDRPYNIAPSMPVIGNIFYYGKDKPVCNIAMGSWIGKVRDLVVRSSVKSADGKVYKMDDIKLSLLDSAKVVLNLPTKLPGAYTLEISIAGLPKEFKKSIRYAIALEPPALTQEQKEVSTYGINVHGGGYVGYEKFARLGFVWVRDYAFNFAWMKRSRGEGAYAGWPWYPKIFAAAENVGMLTLPCLMHAVRPDQDPDAPKGSTEPSDEWRRQIALIVNTFPKVTAWELDNEVDDIRWGTPERYGAYMKAFADILQASAPNKLAVSAGLAGIDVKGAEDFVQGGQFANMDAINGHRYCGIEPPETSRSNANTGMQDARKTYLRDVWRNWKRAASSDGTVRQLWLTEWGYDTRAGQIVTEWEQAAYMQREWVLAMGNGVDKMFWYWYYDSDTDTPKNFFDGCGVFDRFREPKPVAPAFAALRTFLPADYEYIGYANLDANNMAHVLKINGQYIAMAFKVDKNGKGLKITDPKAKEVRDMFGAPIAAGTRTLDIDPVWYIGLDPKCDWIKQCPMDLDNDFFLRNVSGEPIEIRVTNGDTCTYKVEAPAGWVVNKTDYGYDVVGPEGVERGAARITVTGTNGNVTKVMPIDVDIVPQAYAKSNSVDFERNFSVDITNQSATNQDFVVRAVLPQGWKVEPASANTGDLKPDDSANVKFKLISAKAVPASDEVNIPKLEIVNRKGMVIDYAPIVPREWAIHRVKNIKVDGKLSDWKIDNQVPRWMLGPRGDKEATKVYAAYDDGGLYIAMDVADSVCYTSDPNSFWRAADCLEIGISTPASTGAATWSFTLDDHQFWFCPLAEENRVFCGLWGNAKDQKSYGDITKNDPEFKSAMARTADGYTMEVYIPAKYLHGWRAKKGDTLGLMFTLAVRGKRDAREVYWPASKRENAIKQPWKWSKVKLED